MIKLWCYDDPRGWGVNLWQTEWSGISKGLFRDGIHQDMTPGDYVFMRVPQWGEGHAIAKRLARKLVDEGFRLIPDFTTISLYEDKLNQTIAYSEWMPETRILRAGQDTRADVEETIDRLGLPFISKSREGSGSANVRLIKTEREALDEYKRAFKGNGIPVHIGDIKSRQVDYLIWQKFCRGNDSDIRVCQNGNYTMMLERDNAHGVPFASGSHKNRPINDPDDFQVGALDKAQNFFNRYNLKWCGIDLVFDYDEEDWKILETTLGWSLPAYANCQYLGTGWYGNDIWRVLLQQIEDGVFE